MLIDRIAFEFDPGVFQPCDPLIEIVTFEIHHYVVANRRVIGLMN